MLEADLKPLCEGDKIYLQIWPEMKDGKAERIKEISLVAQYKMKIS
jgi:hypothetical protein